MTRFKLKFPQVIIIIFLVVMLLMAYFLNMSFIKIINDSMIKVVMNGVFVLSIIPMLNSGVGMNFGLPIGVCAGLISMCLVINFKITGLLGFGLSLILCIPIGIIFGYVYSKILNRVKGREDIAATFVGFSFIPIMAFFWTLAPFKNREMLWPVGGKGLRPTISLKNYFIKVLDNLFIIDIKGIKIPLGLLMFFAFIAWIIYYFFKTKTGRAMIAIGENENFAKLSGIKINKIRSISVIFSTVLAAIGICVYAQSYGFVELYDAPLMMAFPAISAILIGGFNKGRASIGMAILGTYLFQSIYLLSVPIANELLLPEVAELFRMMITNIIILYALLSKGGNGRHEKRQLS